MAEFPQELLDGYKNYKDTTYSALREDYEHLAIYGQEPKVMVISCCDSRVTPEGIFNAGPGSLFVVRNVANLVPPYEGEPGNHGTSAAIEYAVNNLRVEHLIIMGHCKCGGVQAFRENGGHLEDTGHFIGPWIKLLEPAAVSLACTPVEVNEDPQLGMEYAGVRQSLKNLMGFPFIARKVKEGALNLHGAWFDIGAGELRIMNPETQQFEMADNFLK
ncbi:carbonic anhydrase [Flexibacterium corallicola]|uniref:carbonic anhydrase n=1 Tax=Flexibacterium corallicola TaxID=3037259 RepID=UPI00286F3724|nr:carbonic anhydrase [Pseudovibrio sp. M1P-2-3]